MIEIEKVVSGGYCIGCGACASREAKCVEIVENRFQGYEARIKEYAESESLAKAAEVCPFSNQSLNEDEISKKVFNYEEGGHDDIMGYYRSLYAGHFTDEAVRSKATSGGIITWTLSQLLKSGRADAVIHIKSSDKKGTLFEYGISDSIEEVVKGAKSRYYPIEMSGVMDFVRKNEGRYVFVGIPCFVKAARNLVEKDEVLASRLKYFVGLVCGHLKTKAFADCVGWQAGISPGELKSIDFRHKISERNADDYGLRVESESGEEKIMPARELLGTNWGLGFFKYEACDYCDDIFAETADIAVGDAWLKTYTQDSKGNSVVVTRHPEIDKMLSEGLASGELKLDELSVTEMRDAQGGGFRHRRTGLGYRQYLKERNKEWFPKKRVAVNAGGMNRLRKLVFILRVYLRKKSLEYWSDCRESGNYDQFRRKIWLPTYVYSVLLKTASLGKRLKSKIKKQLG